MFFFNPAKKGWSEIKVKVFVIIYDFYDLAFFIHYRGFGVGFIALGKDFFIPVVIGPGAVLFFDFVCPGIFPWRLVKMTVYANINQIVKKLNR